MDRTTGASHGLAAISLAALLPSPILLILDLGRPDRFYNMLRVLKLRSPMSVGTWMLTTFSAFCGVSALIQVAEDGLLRRMPFVARPLLALPSSLIGAVGMVFAFATSGYTGILVSATAVPLWAKNYLLLGPLFLASALTNATAAIRLVLSLARGTGEDTLKRLERLELVALLAELGLLLAARNNLGPVIGAAIRRRATGPRVSPAGSGRRYHRSAAALFDRPAAATSSCAAGIGSVVRAAYPYWRPIVSLSDRHGRPRLGRRPTGNVRIYACKIGA